MSGLRFLQQMAAMQARAIEDVHVNDATIAAMETIESTVTTPNRQVTFQRSGFLPSGGIEVNPWNSSGTPVSVEDAQRELSHHPLHRTGVRLRRDHRIN